MLETAVGAVTCARTRLSHVRKNRKESFCCLSGFCIQARWGRRPQDTLREVLVGKEPLVLRAWVIPVAALCIVMAEESKCIQSNVIVHCFL